MTFICTECKTKFDDKPQYCDCGNNSFDEAKKSSTIRRLLSSVDKISATIFAICIILSVLIWIL